MNGLSFAAIPQEHALGCGVACVAARCGLSYERALSLFDLPESAWQRGYECVEIVRALARVGLRYEYFAFDPQLHAGALDVPGTIVFVSPCETYPAGHYLIRSREGWMNSWANFPRMVPVLARHEPELAGAVGFVILQCA